MSFIMPQEAVDFKHTAYVDGSGWGIDHGYPFIQDGCGWLNIVRRLPEAADRMADRIVRPVTSRWCLRRRARST